MPCNFLQFGDATFSNSRLQLSVILFYNKQNQIYDDELVTIYYNDLVIDNMEFCVDNKTDHAITVGFWGADSLSINGQQYTSSVVTINAHSKGIYSGYISSMDGSDVQIMQVDSFQGIFGIKDQNNNYIEDINLNFSEK